LVSKLIECEVKIRMLNCDACHDSMMSRPNDDDNNNVQVADSRTKKIINKTFDDAKNNARRTMDETHSELPRYMQTVTDNQEQTVLAARETVENYLESQRKITNSYQNSWISFFDNYFWMSPKRFTEAYARMVSGFSDGTIATIRIWNNMMFTNTGAVKMLMQHTRDNTREISRVSVNVAEMLEKATNSSERNTNY
jgi:hypothetical protein